VPICEIVDDERAGSVRGNSEITGRERGNWERSVGAPNLKGGKIIFCFLFGSFSPKE
jgi:hypothetical protein